MAQAVADAMWRWSDGGALPIVVDAASCTLGLREDVATQLEGERKEQYESLKIIDSIAWCRDLLPNLAISRKLRRVAVHPTCSRRDLGLAARSNRLRRLADEVEVPVGHNLLRHGRRPGAIASRAGRFSDAGSSIGAD